MHHTSSKYFKSFPLTYELRGTINKENRRFNAMIHNAEAPLIVSRTEGIGPQQYGTKSLLGDKFADIEEKYDLTEGAEGFGSEGEEPETGSDDEFVPDTDKDDF